MLRIVGGSARRRIIKIPAGEVRPATSRIRESLFNYISELVAGSRILDLYCGSGALGLEAISRNAREAFFVDMSYKAISTVRENSDTLRFTDRCRFHQQDVFRFLNQFQDNHIQSFDIVFAAPPYKIADPQRILTALEASGAVLPGGIICMEYSRHTPYPEMDSDELHLDRRKEYGETVVDVWDYK